jgi:Dolichyl-phosphate-mannose-protein mannosyltransferase
VKTIPTDESFDVQFDLSAKWRGFGTDLAVVAVLIVIAFLVRRHGLPTQGLWLDDAQEGAARKASLSELIRVGRDHPGYVAVLMGWSRLTGGSDVSLAYPALIAGVVGPALLYLTLRLLAYARWIGVLLGAALVASQSDIIYSGRLKPDTTDVLVVLVLVVLVQRLARTRWRWPTATLWVLAAILLSSNSLFALVAVAVAGLVLLVHPASDLKVRGPAIGLQAAATGALGLAIVGSYNSQAVEMEWRSIWDAFLTFYPNPLRFGAEVLHHLTRIAQVFPGGPGWFATLCMLVAIGGLIIEAWRGPRAIVARYLLLVLAVAFVGGALGKIPFGPEVADPISTGGRASLWLVPVMAVGLAAVLQRVRSSIPLSGFPIALDIVACAGAAVTLGFALEATPLPYPFTDTQPAVSFAESHLGRRDALLLPFAATASFPGWNPAATSFAAESHFAFLSKADTTGTLGFTPRFNDPRIHDVGVRPVDTEQVADDVGHAKGVLVYYSGPSFFSQVGAAQNITALDDTLVTLGFQSEVFHFGDASVEVWKHRSGTLPTTSVSFRRRERRFPA